MTPLLHPTLNNERNIIIIVQTETIFPLQKKIWESLLKRHDENHLPHALLFSGMDGLGKKQFAHAFATFLLCNTPQKNNPCGQCKSCHLQKAQSHPDFMHVTPEEDAQFIKIDQIREVVGFVNGTALLGGYRVIVIDPASAMNTQAANALLKTLEEPTAKTLFMLIANQNMRLPATITSRCQKIVFPKPERDIALTWLRSNVQSDNVDMLPLLLNLTEGAPLKVRDFLTNDTCSFRKNLYDGLVQLNTKQKNPLQFAETWEDKDVKMILNLLLIWIRDLLRCKLTASQAEIINTDYQSAIVKIVSKMAPENILHYLDWVQKTYADILNSLNVNRQLLLKETFIRWVRLC